MEENLNQLYMTVDKKFLLNITKNHTYTLSNQIIKINKYINNLLRKYLPNNFEKQKKNIL